MAFALELSLPENALIQHERSFETLLERAASGDHAAFEQIMVQTQQRVAALTWRMLGNEADARDATQEVFLRFYKSLGRVRSDLDPSAWLYRIAVNVCRDIAASRGRRQQQFPSLEAGATAVSLEDDAEEALVRRQERELIASAIATLPEKERASVILRDIEGLSTEEVARILDSTPPTVRSQISSARKKIRAFCEPYFRGTR